LGSKVEELKSMTKRKKIKVFFPKQTKQKTWRISWTRISGRPFSAKPLAFYSFPYLFPPLPFDFSLA